MYVPATPLSAAPLDQAGIVVAADEPTRASQANGAGGPERTALKLVRDELNVLADHRARIAGELLSDRRPAPAGQLVTLQALGRRGWHAVASTRTGARGRFRLSYSPRRTGSRWVRLRYAGAGPELGSHRRLGWLNVYRLAEASWYGGGGGLACGGELTSSTMGVANKTLPCGTLVTLHYDGRTVRVPVVDRGPYVAGREFDLTEATKAALGFSGVGEVWSTD